MLQSVIDGIELPQTPAKVLGRAVFAAGLLSLCIAITGTLVRLDPAADALRDSATPVAQPAAALSQSDTDRA
ncbi:hypothetical protein EKE94_00205 [Mesobaculum littorinae]|uniref:Uncharacterized protein n=1 Tax=Mesobaculum littorinae TaxID=2486419 RepID=A0A438AKM7_9RHOB|nr:hypothetical protein [Mesobaculum littorinae]RVV99156.1 hypothetical protein EKE94_00205 [Mesobaculum littorinae]